MSQAIKKCTCGCCDETNEIVFDPQHNTALHLAAMNGCCSAALACLENGCSTGVLNAQDHTPIEVSKNTDIIRLILDFCSGYKPSVYPIPGQKYPDISPFRELPAGPASYLFWTAIGVGKDNYMFREYGLYPFDWLTDTERILVLTEVAEAMSGYTQLSRNFLNECALFAIFSFMKNRIMKELDDELEFSEHSASSCIWRTRVLEAYEQVYDTSCSLAGLSVDCVKSSVWNCVVNLLSRSLFGESFWEKKKMFCSENQSERSFFLNYFSVPEDYFETHLPSTSFLSHSQVQLTFKKLITMSKNFTCDEPLESGCCFCPECIAEREVPLSFKLQFLDEAAEENKRSKKLRRIKEKKGSSRKDDIDSERKLDEIVLTRAAEIKQFWLNLDNDTRTSIMDLPSTELHEAISNNQNWESLRMALNLCMRFSFEDEIINFTEDSVTLTDSTIDILSVIISALKQHHSNALQISGPLSNEDWEKKCLKLLQNLVLCEFARKLARQFLIQKEENRAQKVQQELELELLQEEELQQKIEEKKIKRKNKQKKKKKKHTEEEEINLDKIENEGVEHTISLKGEVHSFDDNPFAMLEQAHRKNEKIGETKENNYETTETKKKIKEKEKKGPKHSYEKSEKIEVEKNKDTPDNSKKVPILNPSSNNPMNKPPVEDWFSHFLDGMMFICTNETINEVMELRLLGLPRSHSKLVSSLRSHTSAIFLYNFTTHKLYGVFEADSNGGETFNPTAWCRIKTKNTPFPCQVRFKLLTEFEPINENLFSHLLIEGNHIRKFNQTQVRELINIFINQSRSVSPSHSITLLKITPNQYESTTHNHTHTTSERSVNEPSNIMSYESWKYPNLPQSIEHPNTSIPLMVSANYPSNDNVTVTRPPTFTSHAPTSAVPAAQLTERLKTNNPLMAFGNWGSIWDKQNEPISSGSLLSENAQNLSNISSNSLLTAQNTSNIDTLPNLHSASNTQNNTPNISSISSIPQFPITSLRANTLSASSPAFMPSSASTYQYGSNTIQNTGPSHYLPQQPHHLSSMHPYINTLHNSFNAPNLPPSNVNNRSYVNQVQSSSNDTTKLDLLDDEDLFAFVQSNLDSFAADEEKIRAEQLLGTEYHNPTLNSFSLIIPIVC